MHTLKCMLGENGFLGKIDLKNGYFSVPLSKQFKKYIKFAWLGNLYEFILRKSFPLLWSMTCSMEFCKTAKYCNSSVIGFHHPQQFFSTYAASIPATITDCITSTERFIQGINILRSFSQGRTVLVDSKFKVRKWQVLNADTTQNGHSN